jgi:ABC-2 type transport system ATP-binding protein
MTWSVQNVAVTYGHVTALVGVGMTIEPGRVHSVVGGDGAGKSTLLKVLAGLDLGQTGTLRLPPQRQVGYVPGSGGLFADLTVEENLEFVAQAHRMRDWRPRASELLERSDIASFGDRLAGRLSGGQRRKLAASMALLPRPALLVLDEVTTGVDPVSRMELWRLIGTSASDGAAVVASTTYLDEAERAESVTLMADGKVLAEGSPGDIIAAVPGSVADADGPGPRSWRRGRRWRCWDPDGHPVDGVTLEDAAIVHELMEGAP